MDPDDPCRCRVRTSRFHSPSPHLCAISCSLHAADELRHQVQLTLQNEPVQLRLF